MCFITLFFFFSPFSFPFFQVLLQILPCFSIWTKMARIYIPVFTCFELARISTRALEAVAAKWKQLFPALSQQSNLGNGWRSAIVTPECQIFKVNILYNFTVLYHYANQQYFNSILSNGRCLLGNPAIGIYCTNSQCRKMTRLNNIQNQTCTYVICLW